MNKLATGLNADCYLYANPSYTQKKYIYHPNNQPSALVRAPGRVVDYK
jgi:hypothetical protein